MSPKESGHQVKNIILETLLRINAVSKDNIELLSDHTRDKPDLSVFTDCKTGVIFINAFFVGESEYIDGGYRKMKLIDNIHEGVRYEDDRDTARRFDAYKQFIAGKDICDFGCGSGNFLKKAKKLAEKKEEVKEYKDMTESVTLFVRNIGFETNEKKFRVFMEKFGPVKYAVLCKTNALKPEDIGQEDPEAKTAHKGTGFVKFMAKEPAF